MAHSPIWNVSTDRNGTKMSIRSDGVRFDMRLDNRDAQKLGAALLSAGEPHGVLAVPVFIWDEVCKLAGVADPLTEHWESIR